MVSEALDRENFLVVGVDFSDPGHFHATEYYGILADAHKQIVFVFALHDGLIAVPEQLV